MFWLIVLIVCGSDFESTKRADFNADRERMLPGIYDPAAMKAALPVNVPMLHGHLELIERQLAVRWTSPEAGNLVVHFPRSAGVILD